MVSYDDETILDAVAELRREKLAVEITGVGMRVPKYAQRLSETLNLGRRELALLCTLLLRGRQTAGELRDRSERMHRFEDMEEAETCLNHLVEMELAARLPRQPGEKEARYVHLLSGPVGAGPEAAVAAPPPSSRLDRLEAEIEELKRQFAEFRKQFE